MANTIMTIPGHIYLDSLSTHPSFVNSRSKHRLQLQIEIHLYERKRGCILVYVCVQGSCGTKMYTRILTEKKTVSGHNAGTRVETGKLALQICGYLSTSLNH